MKNNKKGRKKYKIYSLERKGALGSLILQLRHMLSEPVTIKEINATEQGTDVH